jgi:hypothetical protein
MRVRLDGTYGIELYADNLQYHRTTHRRTSALRDA